MQQKLKSELVDSLDTIAELVTDETLSRSAKLDAIADELELQDEDDDDDEDEDE